MSLHNKISRALRKAGRQQFKTRRKRKSMVQQQQRQQLVVVSLQKSKSDLRTFCIYKHRKHHVKWANKKKESLSLWIWAFSVSSMREFAVFYTIFISLLGYSFLGNSFQRAVHFKNKKSDPVSFPLVHIFTLILSFLFKFLFSSSCIFC